MTTPFGVFPDSMEHAFNLAGQAIPGLSDEEFRTMNYLSSLLWNKRGDYALSQLYFDGLQNVPALGISTPPELADLKAIMGWGAAGVEAVEERLEVRNFRLPGKTTADEDLQHIWELNNLSAEQGPLHLDSFIYGNGHAIVGVDEDGDAKITVESPFNIVSLYDPRARRTTCAFQAWTEPDPASPLYAKMRAALYMPHATIQFMNEGSKWEEIDRDPHDLGVVPVVSFINRRMSNNRFGESEMRPAWRNCIDRAARTSVSMEIIREFFQAPKMLVLGATEQAFKNKDGGTKTAWETYVGRVWALEADLNGQLPQVQRFESEDPAKIIALLDHETRIMAGLTGLPPQYLGIFSDGNPASADAIRMSDFRLQRKAERKALVLGDCWEAVMRLAFVVRGEKVPEDMKRLETDWAPMGIPTPAADTDAAVKQVTAGLVPAVSDTLLARLGYTANERERLANERTKEEGKKRLEAIMQGAQGAPGQTPGATPPGAPAGQSAPLNKAPAKETHAPNAGKPQ